MFYNNIQSNIIAREIMEMEFKRNVSAKVQDTKKWLLIMLHAFLCVCSSSIVLFSSPFSICLQVLEFLKDYFIYI